MSARLIRTIRFQVAETRTSKHPPRAGTAPDVAELACHVGELAGQLGPGPENASRSTRLPTLMSGALYRGGAARHKGDPCQRQGRRNHRLALMSMSAEKAAKKAATASR